MRLGRKGMPVFSLSLFTNCTGIERLITCGMTNSTRLYLVGNKERRQTASRKRTRQTGQRIARTCALVSWYAGHWHRRNANCTQCVPSLFMLRALYFAAVIKRASALRGVTRILQTRRECAGPRLSTRVSNLCFLCAFFDYEWREPPIEWKSIVCVSRLSFWRSLSKLGRLILNHVDTNRCKSLLTFFFLHTHKSVLYASF